HRLITTAYGNDVASWVASQVRDQVLAERLAVINPFEFATLEDLREELMSSVHDHLIRLSTVPRVEFGEAFYFQQSHIVEVPLGPAAVTLAEFRDALAAVDTSAVDIVLRLAERMRGRRFLHLSGGRFGGGAAEILQPLVPMLTDLGVDAAWEITGGDPGFYATASALRAALGGAERLLTDEGLDHYVEMNRVNAKKLVLEADLVLVHDVQPATLVAHRPAQ